MACSAQYLQSLLCRCVCQVSQLTSTRHSLYVIFKPCNVMPVCCLLHLARLCQYHRKTGLCDPHSLVISGLHYAGIRGPTRSGKAFNSLLESKQLRAAGAMNDPHGTWLFAMHLSDPDYIFTVSAQNRYLNPGLALISHPKPRSSSSSVQAGSSLAASSTVPGSFQPVLAAGFPSNAPPPFSTLLVAPGSPALPVLSHQQTVTKAAGSDTASVLTVSWSVPAGSPAVQQFRLFVAADAMFSELLRQPAGDAFGPPDIPGGTRSVDVVVGSRLADGEVYVLLLACSAETCRASCVQHVTSGAQQQPAAAAAAAAAVRPS
jgi:hypothetical protein